MLVSLPLTNNNAVNNMARAIRKKSGTGVKTNWHFIWSCSEIDKMITRTDPMIFIGVNESTITSATAIRLLSLNVQGLYIPISSNHQWLAE